MRLLVVGHARKTVDVHAVGGQPAGQREQVRVGDGEALTHHPRPAQQFALDPVEAVAHVLCHLGPHRRLRGFVVGPAVGPRPVRVGHVHVGTEPVVHRLQFGQGKGVVQRRQPGLRVRLRQVQQQCRRLGDHAAIGHQCRHAALGVDGQEFGRLLLVGLEVQAHGLVAGRPRAPARCGWPGRAGEAGRSRSAASWGSRALSVKGLHCRASWIRTGTDWQLNACAGAATFAQAGPPCRRNRPA